MNVRTVALIAVVAALTPDAARAQQAESTLPAPQAPNTSPFAGSVPLAAVSPQPLALSLAEAVDRGLRHNLGLLLQEQAARTASAARWRALADLLPDISATLGQRRQVINLEAFGFPAERPIVGPFDVFDARVFLSQPIIDLEAINNARAAAAYERAEAQGVRSARDLVVLVSVNLYLQVVADSSRINVARAQLETAEALFRQATDLKNAGLIAGIDVLRAQVQFQTLRQRLIAAENEFEKAKLQLARAIGLPVRQAFTLTDAIPYAPLPEVTLDAAMARARASRADYLAAQERVAAAEAERRAATGQLLPSLSVDADYGAIGQRLPDAHSTYTVAATVRVPLFEGGRAQADRAEAAVRLARRQAELADFGERIEFEVRSALLDVGAASRQLEAAQTNITLANQELAQARDRFAAGVAGNIEVTQAQESVAAASETYIAALYAHNVAKALLARAVGTAEEAVNSLLGGRP